MDAFSTSLITGYENKRYATEVSSVTRGQIKVTTLPPSSEPNTLVKLGLY